MSFTYINEATYQFSDLYLQGKSSNSWVLQSVIQVSSMESKRTLWVPERSLYDGDAFRHGLGVSTALFFTNVYNITHLLNLILSNNLVWYSSLTSFSFICCSSLQNWATLGVKLRTLANFCTPNSFFKCFLYIFLGHTSWKKRVYMSLRNYTFLHRIRRVEISTAGSIVL